MKRHLSVLACTLLFTLGAWASEPGPTPKPKNTEEERQELAKLGGFDPMPADAADFNIHVEFLIVDIADKDAVALIPKLRDPAQIEKGYATILEMLAMEHAQLVSWPMIITKPGERAVVEDIDEVRYPIEFESGGVILKPGVQAEEDAKKKDQPAPPPNTYPPDHAQPQGNAAPPDNPPAPPPNQPTPADDPPLLWDPIPTTFETRNTGVTLEIEPTLDPRTMMISAQLAAQHVHFPGMEKQTVETAGRKATVEQPRFLTNKITTNLSLRSGQRILLDSFRAKQRPGWTELFFLQITARQNGK